MSTWRKEQANAFFEFLGAPKGWIARGIIALFGLFGGAIGYVIAQVLIIPRMLENIEATDMQIEVLTDIFVGACALGSFFIGVYAWKHWLSKVITWKI